MITPGSSQKRKVGLDPVTRLKFSGLHTGGTTTFSYSGPLLKAGPPFSGGPADKQRAPPEPRWGLSTWPEWGKKTVQTTQGTDSDTNTQHICELSPPSLPCPGPDAKAGGGGPPWRLHGAQGKVREGQHWTRRNSWVLPNQSDAQDLYFESKRGSRESFPVQMDYLNAYLL